MKSRIEQEGAEIAEVMENRFSASSATSCSKALSSLKSRIEQERAEAAEVLGSRFSAFSASSC
jgi:hypothetical protein